MKFNSVHVSGEDWAEYKAERKIGKIPVPEREKGDVAMIEIPRIARLILEIPSSYGLKGKFLHDCYLDLMRIEMERDKPLSDDHVKQLAVKWAKEHREEMESYWKEWRA